MRYHDLALNWGLAVSIGILGTFARTDLKLLLDVEFQWQLLTKKFRDRFGLPWEEPVGT